MKVAVIMLAGLLQQDPQIDGLFSKKEIAFGDRGMTQIVVEADLDTPTTDDEVIYFVPSGGTPTPLVMGAGGTFFREGALIIGGPLDGESWDDATAFFETLCNGPGDVIIEGEIETAIDELEQKIMAALPSVNRIYIEPEALTRPARRFGRKGLPTV